MKYYFPPRNQSYSFLQTNRSDDLGSIWSSFNLDFQTNLGVIRLSQKLVSTTTTTDESTMGVTSAFEYFDDRWFAIAGSLIMRTSNEQITNVFSADTASPYVVPTATSTTQFDITNPAGTTFRYTYDGTGTDPLITAAKFPIGGTIIIAAENFSAANNGTFTITGVSAGLYFEVSNPFGVVESNKTIGNGYLAVAGGSLGTNYNTQYSDLALFDARLWATSKDTLWSKASGTSGNGLWTRRDTLETNRLHKLLYFKKFNRLYYIDTETAISSIDTANVVTNSAGDYYINLTSIIGDPTTMVASSQYIWIGALKIDNSTVAYGTRGSILQWDGISAQVTNEFLLETAGVLAMVVLNDIPYAIDSEGRILKYTGYSFEEIQRLPIVRTQLTASTEIDPSNGRFIHFNGMVATKNNTIQVFINNLNSDAQANVAENIQSGVWELDLDTKNFTHRYSTTLKPVGSTTITDYGQSRVNYVGALKVNTLSSTNSNGRGTLLAGLGYYTDATTVKYGIFIDSPSDPSTNKEGQKRGYVVTTWFNTTEVEDKFTRLWDIHKRFLDATDKIVYKYRIIEENPVLATITWTSTTTFTTTTDVSAYAPTATGFNGTSGGEVEVQQGTGAGSCTHITSIVNNAGTYTVTLDTAVTGVTGTAKARFQKWIKLFPDVTGLVKSWEQLAIAANNTQIQIKCCMEFTGDMEFHRLAIFSNEDIKVNA